jgi:hypothetical protein
MTQTLAIDTFEQPPAIPTAHACSTLTLCSFADCDTALLGAAERLMHRYEL